MRLLESFALLLWLQTCCASYAEEGEPYKLHCDVVGEVRRWYLHGEGPAYQCIAPQCIGTVGRINVSKDGCLVFSNVSASDEGRHLCVFQDGSGGLQAMGVAMKVRPVTPSNLWEGRYKEKFLRAIVAALVFASLLSWGCLVGRYTHVGAVGLDANPNPLGDKGHQNPTLEMEASYGWDPARY